MKLQNAKRMFAGVLLMLIGLSAVPVGGEVVRAEDVQTTNEVQIQDDTLMQNDTEGNTDAPLDEVTGHVHEYSGEMTVDKSASCVEEGTQSIHCIICGEKKEGSEENIPVKEHTYGAWVVVEKPTYDREGRREQKCSVCGYINASTIEKLTGVWKQNTIGWWYELTDGSYFTNCRKIINGSLYVFDASGYMQTGWVLQGGSWSYHSSSGVALQGWQRLGGNWYYFNESAIMTSGWQIIGGNWYYLDSSGVMKTGWQIIGGSWYYLDSSGVMKTGWQIIGGSWYYLDSSGVMKTGWQIIGGNWYYLDNSGVMKTGWQIIGGNWYYLDSSGVMKTGWQIIGGNWYYLDSSGVMKTGWQTIGGNWYYLDSSGVMKTGWQYLGGKWYYLNGSGVMLTGWQSIGGSWYYFYGENDSNRGNGDGWGTMAVNKVIDGWIIYESGKAFPEGTIEGKIEQIKAYVGVPYRLGGSSPSGWDCSGFTRWALNFLGVNIPTTSALQAMGGVAVDKYNMNSWKPGDILVYKSGSRVNHVALYLGDGLLMHALSVKYGTLIQDVLYYEKWDKKNNLADVRRYL